MHTAVALVSILLLSSTIPTRAAFDAPPPTREQIEADWLRQDAVRSLPGNTGQAVSPSEDAAGAVDGVKTGQWGFHTQSEPDPWWQVDLQEVVRLGKIRIWNRCDAHASRNARLQVFGSESGIDFKILYQHNGGVFYGFSDQQPLKIDLTGASARYLKLTIPGTDYFHLDEIEVFPAGGNRNLALGKPATQSSVSPWSIKHLQDEKPQVSKSLALALNRGRKLVESQSRLGVKTESFSKRLAELESSAKRHSDAGAEDRLRETYLQIRELVRDLALGNPLLSFDAILFVKRAPTAFPHMSDQHYGWWARAGGGIYLLEGVKGNQPRVRCLTAGFPEGSFSGPDLSWDGRKVLFAYCRFHPELHAESNKAEKTRVPEDAFNHIYEVNLDGTGRRQITHGRYDDFEPRYLPTGDIVFLSTRKGQAIQLTKAGAEATLTLDLPDSYVRCGGDNWRPVPVFTLHAMDAEGRNLRPVSAFENFEWAPSVANDGRLLYTRWDYIDRFNGHFFSLWSANQDGTNPQLVYGNYTVKPQVVLEARSIPRSSKLVFTACAHHSITGGSLCLLDRERGTEEEAPLTRVTPEVCFPETEGWPEHYYANPWPLSEEYFLVGWADAKLPPHRFVTDGTNPTNAMGIYLLDAFGNQELLYRDPLISSCSPMPVMARAKPPVHSEIAKWDGAQEGSLLVQDVYVGLTGVPRGSVKQLRVVAVPPKVQPHMNQPSIGVSAEDPGKYVLGTIPVEIDGSAHFRVPSGVPVFFQALDDKGLAVQTMRSLTYVMPGEALSCIGCHEQRDLAPPIGKPPLAALRAPSKFAPAPDGSWPLSFDRLVQPVLDRHCTRCHRPDGDDPKAAKLDLTDRSAIQTLLGFGKEDLKKLAFERDRSVPRQMTAANSKLWKHLTQPGGHSGIVLDHASLERLATWMDTYAQRQGHFSDSQAQALAAFRERLQQ